MTRNLFIKIRCTEQEKDMLFEKARKAKMKLSDYVRIKLGVPTKFYGKGKIVDTLLETKNKKMCPQCEKMISKRGYHRHTKYCVGS